MEQSSRTMNLHQYGITRLSVVCNAYLVDLNFYKSPVYNTLGMQLVINARNFTSQYGGE